MANVALISCNSAADPYPVYPLGMSMVAAAARERGHSVLQHDVLSCGEATEPSLRTVSSFHPDVVGLSLRNVDNVDSTGPVSYAAQYIELARTLRDQNSCPIVLGGSAYSLFPEALLTLLGADYGVVGEGERAFVHLLDLLAADQRPKERVLREHDVSCGTALSTATRRDPGLVSFYLEQGGLLNVQTKRGCPHHCAYCCYPVLEGSTYRFRSPKAVVDEIAMLIKQYGADYYVMVDAVLNDGEGHYLQVAEELVRRGIRVPWLAYLRPQKFRREDVDLLRRAGLHAVEWGTDGCCDVTLAGLSKGFTWAEVEHSNRLFSQAGIACAHFVIFGGPGETEETIREGLRNIEGLERCVVIAYAGIRILPNTPIHRRALAEGLISRDQSLLEPVFYFSPQLERAQLHKTIAEAFATRADCIYPPGRDAEKTRAFRTLGYREPLWTLLLNGHARRRAQ